MLRHYLNSFKKIFSVVKKVVLVLAVFFMIFRLFHIIIKKDRISILPQTELIKQNRAEIYKVINDKKLNKISVAIYRLTMCNILGEACTNNPADADKNFQKSISGIFANLIVFPYQYPPASGIAWVKSGLEDVGFIPKTLAAEGIGFTAIKPFANIWKIFRDVSYMLLVIVLIAIGFMIMFRAKLNPQTVMTVENALPKIVISLILITFSFAIAGFLIDIMYISIGLIVSIMIKIPDNPTLFKNQYMMSSMGDLWRDVRIRQPLLPGVGSILGNAFMGVIPGYVRATLHVIAGFLTVVIVDWGIYRFAGDFSKIAGLEDVNIAAEGIGKTLSSFFHFTFSTWYMYVAFFVGMFLLIPIIMDILIFFSIFYMVIRIFMLLFTSYLKLILNIILGPLLLIFEAVPGKNAFKYWFMNLLGNLIPFPIVVFVFVLAYSVINTTATDLTARLPYLYGIESNAFKVLISFGLIFLIPDLVKTAKEALGIKELPFNVGIGTFFGGVAAGTGGATSILSQFGTINLGLSAFTGGKGLADIMGKFKRPPLKPKPNPPLNATGGELAGE